MNTRNVALWTLYDFANSIVMIVFFLYFSQWLVVENGVSDFWYNMLFTIGSVFLLLTAPVVGAIADRTGGEQRYLGVVTALCAFFYLCTALTALFFPGHAFLAAAFFVLANYFYQFSFVFYNALLHRIAEPSQWGRVSGIGQAGNWLGQMAGLLVTLPFALGTIVFVGASGRPQTFLPAIALFVLLALPMLFFLRLPPHGEHAGRIDLPAHVRGQWRQLRSLLRAPGMGTFLLAYFFFNDAIITVSNNFPIYLQNVYGVSDDVKSLLLLGILLTSALGALVSGWVTDRLGIKRALVLSLASWVVVFPLMGLTEDFRVFVILCVIIGLLFGAIWTITRAAMTALCPPDTLNFGFSFYTLAERVSTLVGPLAWGAITSALADEGPVRYRIAVIAMGFFVAVGLLILRNTRIGS